MSSPVLYLPGITKTYSSGDLSFQAQFAKR